MPIVIGMVCMSFVAYNGLIVVFEYFGKRMNEILRYPQKPGFWGTSFFVYVYAGKNRIGQGPNIPDFFA